MPGPFRFLDRIDQLVAGPSSVATAVRELVRPGGDRPVTKAGDASRIPEPDVRAHVVGVALDVVKFRVRDGLVDALRDHLDEVRGEHELVEGPCPEEGTGSFCYDQWCVNFEGALRDSFRDGDLREVAADGSVDVAEPEILADVVLAQDVADPDAVLARVGLTAAVLDEIVADIRKPPASVIVEVLPPAVSKPWSLERLAGSWAFTGEPGDAELFREAVTYVLGDLEMIDTGAELLGLAGDEAFLTWARERAAFSDPAQDEADVAEVLRLAGAGRNEERGCATGTGPEARTQTDTAAGGEGAPSAALMPQADYDAALQRNNAQDRRRLADHHGELARQDAEMRAAQMRVTDGNEKPSRSATVGETVLTRAAGAALAALYDHGCETDKAMAEALGVQKAVVNQSRHGKTPWAPDAGQRDGLLGLVTSHLTALEAARDGLLAVSS